MSAEAIAKALGARKAGSGWTARCPAHDDRTPSLSIRDAEGSKVLVRCHAGCEQERVITARRAHGLWGENLRRSVLRCARHTPVERKPDQNDATRSQAPLAIWRSAKLANRHGDREARQRQLVTIQRDCRPAQPGIFGSAIPSANQGACKP